MTNLKHVGRIAKSKAPVVVAYKVVPGEPENCIVVTTSNLSADEHDTLMKTVESEAGQREDEFANAMARTVLPDGRTMLPWFHASGKLVKMPTAEIEMMPNRNTSIMLNELNELIAQQRGVSVADLALGGARPAPQPVAEVSKEDAVAAYQSGEAVQEAVQAPTDGVLTDDDLAAQMRSQADAMFKEAKRLRDEAEALSPTKRTTKKASTKKVDDKVT